MFVINRKLWIQSNLVKIFLTTMLIWTSLIGGAVADNIKVKLIKESKFWRASKYIDPSNKSLTCFISSVPIQAIPKNVKRGPILFFVSSVPKLNIEHEISFKSGYPYKKNSLTTVTIGFKKFKLETNGEGAWINDLSQQNDLVEALKKGSQMIIIGRSSRGTLTTDTFSLSGVTAAINAMDKNCKK